MHMTKTPDILVVDILFGRMKVYGVQNNFILLVLRKSITISHLFGRSSINRLRLLYPGHDAKPGYSQLNHAG